MFRRGDGHWGYVWVAHTDAAVWMLFSPTMAAAVPGAHLGWLRGKGAVCDGYPGYRGFFGAIQRSRGHLLAEAERPGPGMEAGLEGFGPSTTGLKVRCATWLRHRPCARLPDAYNLAF